MSDWGPGPDGWAVQHHAGQHIESGFGSLEILLLGDDVDGAMGAFVFTHPVIAENPPHAHPGFMKILYILEGSYDFRVGNGAPWRPQH
jgi:quercetin dioxygenase-like cupin family protein